MVNNPFVSVIIPVYNCRKYISDAVDSIEKQPVKDLEIIIVNDGSKDGSAEICDSLANKYNNIRVFHQPNSGVSVARNLGLDQAKGKYIAFLDADDLWCKNFYDQDLYTYLLGSDEDLISFDMMAASNDLKRGKKMNCGYDDQSLDKLDLLKSNMFFCTYLYKRNVIENIRFTPNVKFNEDIEFLYRAFINSTKVMKFDKYICIYRMNPNSFMHSAKDNTKTSLETVKLWEKNLVECKNNSNIKPEDKKRLMLFCLSRQITFAYLYIQQAAEQRQTNKEILSALSDNMDIDRLKDVEHLYLYEDVRQIYREYWNDPEKFVDRNKKKYIINKIKCAAKKQRLVRLLLTKREKKWFTENIDFYV